MDLNLPKNSCEYNYFDDVTLEPLSGKTATRLLELRLDKLSFSGKTVLDIGCNNGYLSFIASRMGAKSITALDVQRELLEYVEKTSAERFPNVKVERQDFKTLDPGLYKADVVLFLEVLHWVVSQGLTIQSAIEKLAALTGEMALIEFPWSVDEPSIKAQTTLTANEYNAGTILDELSKHFRSIEVVNFNSYFKGQTGSQRVLVIAREPKNTIFLAKWFPGIARIEADVRHRDAKITLSCDDSSVYAVKKIREASPILELPNEVLHAIFDSLKLTGSLRVVAPELRGDQYIFDRNALEKYIVYRWVGSLPLPFLGGNQQSVTHEDIVSVAVEITKALRAAYLKVGNSPIVNRIIERMVRNISALEGEAEQGGQGRFDDAELYSFSHADVHTGNVVRVGSQLLLVDLENVGVNSTFFDVLWSIVMSGVTNKRLIMGALRETEVFVGRSIRRFDIQCVRVAYGKWERSARLRQNLREWRALSKRCDAALKLISELAVPAS